MSNTDPMTMQTLLGLIKIASMFDKNIWLMEVQDPTGQFTCAFEIKEPITHASLTKSLQANKPESVAVFQQHDKTTVRYFGYEDYPIQIHPANLAYLKNVIQSAMGDFTERVPPKEKLNPSIFKPTPQE